MKAPTVIEVRLRTPLPVTVHGQVPVVVQGHVPVIATSPLPVSVQHPDSALAWVTAGIALATLIAVGYQIVLSFRELKVVEQEAAIIGRKAKLGLVTPVETGEYWIEGNFDVTSEGKVITFASYFNIFIQNSGNRAAPNALLYFWLPPRCRLSGGPDTKEHVKDEGRPPRKFADVDHTLWSWAVNRPVYPEPFRTRETLRLDLASWDTWWYEKKQVPAPMTLYWQVVCDDGTYPSAETPASMKVYFRSINRS